MKNRLAAISLTVGLVGGAIAGLAVGISNSAGAATSPSTTAPAAATAPASPGTFKSNEDKAHEAGESAAQEKAEDSGHFRGGPGHWNEDPAHEATESPAREAQETPPAGAQAPATQPPPASLPAA